jgi:hypothetical protein
MGWGGVGGVGEGAKFYHHSPAHSRAKPIFNFQVMVLVNNKVKVAQNSAKSETFNRK